MRELMEKWVKGMPDLSFYPENYLLRNAFGNPVLFGEQHRAEIAALVDISNLELLPFEKAGGGISEALESEDPLQRYWGLIVCSAFGKEAVEFKERAMLLCQDPDLLVRTRAAEFLGLSGLDDPVPAILEALYSSQDGVEALLILNSLVLLMDGPRAYKFELDSERLSRAVSGDPQVQRRLEYIHSRMASSGQLIKR